MKRNGLTGIAFIALFSAALFVAGADGDPVGEGESAGAGGASRLAKGAALFREGRFDEALAELNAAVSVNERCPAAYYYAARIRFEKGQYGRALTNLRAALRDSADFADAAGFLAFVLKRTGKEDEAAREWRRFTRLAGLPAGGMPVSADSIMLPEEYRKALDAARANRKVEKAGSPASLGKPAAPENVTEVSADSPVTADSTGMRPGAASVLSAADTASAGAGSAAGGYDDIDRRIESEIRKGIYGIIAVVVLLSGGTLAVVLWWRKRDAARSELIFSKEVEQLLESAGEGEDLLESEEERLLREFRERRADIMGASAVPPVPGARPAPPPERNTAAVPETTETDAAGMEASGVFPDVPGGAPGRPLSRGRGERPGEGAPRAGTGERSPITEEIKALVTRMHREGHGIEEICRAADLTRTEVELIIAVRAKHVERLIEEASEENDDCLDHDGLYRAISELKAGGDTPREIARKLGISMSEINFALAVMEERRGRGRST